MHHDACMRTTVTLDKDVERLLRNAMHRSRKSFKETLNEAVRTALGPKSGVESPKKFRVRARPLGLRAGMDPAGFNRLADDLEVESYLEKHRSPAKP